MNERIRQLAEQCRMSELVDSWEYEEFAELIIAECARIARATPCPYDDEVRQRLGHTWDIAALEAGRSIKDYFGVRQ